MVVTTEQAPRNEFCKVKELRPVNPENETLMVELLSWFQDPKVKDHLVGIPGTVEGLRDYYQTKGVHGFVGVNERDNPISVVTLRDPGDPDSFARTTSALVERLCVKPPLIRRKKGIGTQTMLKALEKAFSSREGDGFDYAKLGLGVIIGPKYWEYARDLFRKVGFWEVGTRRYEVVIERPGGRTTEYDVFLMETSKGHFNDYIRRGPLYPQHSST